MGSGKASARMALALENRLGDKIEDGVVICPKGAKTGTRKIRQYEGSHPLPGRDSVEAAGKLVDLAKNISPGDLVLYVMSGGSSALLCLPPEEVPLSSLRQTYRVLLGSGADIREMNTVRKHLSLVKGGRLGKMLKDAILINLVISDVPGDIREDIGSGPLVADTTTFTDAMKVLEKYDMKSSLPEEVIGYIQKGIDGEAEGTVKYGFPRHRYYLLGNARYTAQQASLASEKLGYSVYRSNRAYSGETKKVAGDMCSRALTVLDRDQPVPKPAALIFFGESYVKVKGKGKGGRNQELALWASLQLEGRHHISLLSAGTDGRDGPTDAAGAICNGNTVNAAKEAGIHPESYLENNDSYPFFDAVDGLIRTGDTNNNVMDLQIILVENE